MKVTAGDNVTVLATYTYCDSNERLITDESGYRTYYATNGGTVIAEYSETPALPTTPKWSKTYVYLGGRLLSTLTPNGAGGEAVNYHHPDRLGTRLVTDPVAGTSFEQVTLPFGTALGAESPGAPDKRFTSYDNSDTSKLDYAVNRHYDSQQGRFTQTDPIGMGGASISDPQSLNAFSYTQNDPVNFVDPFGLSPDFPEAYWGFDHFANGFWGWGNLIDRPHNTGRNIIAKAEDDYNKRAFRFLPIDEATVLALEFGSQNTSQNPNCIEGAVPGGRLAGRGLEEAISSITGPRGVPIHDGEHVLVPPGTTANVTALSLMAGQILHSGRQTADRNSASYAYSVVDILLNTRINGQQYVMTLKDMFYDTGKLSWRVNAGDVLGSVEGHSNPNDEAGLHVTLYPYSVYKQYIQNKGFGPAARSSVPFKSLMSAGHDPQSPFRCP